MQYHECSILLCTSSDYLAVWFGDQEPKEQFNSKIINYSSDINNSLSLIHRLIPVTPWSRFSIYYNDKIFRSQNSF